MKLLSVLCLLMLSACSVQARSDDSLLRLESPNGGVCSGTVIKPNVILTATHCLKEGEAITAVNSSRTELDVKEFIHDGRDNSLIILNKNQFKVVSWVDFRNKQKKGDELYIYGNVMGLESMLRRGYVSGFTNIGYDVTLYDINAYKGDSGSCMFNKRGVCVAVYGFFIVSPDGVFKLGGSGKFGFDKNVLRKYNL